MRIVANEFMSLDGVVQAPGGPEEDTDGGFAQGGWSIPYFDPEVMGAVIGEGMATAEALLFGRRTWQGMAAAWPDRAGDPYADAMNAIPKYVASRSLTDADMTWNSLQLGQRFKVANSLNGVHFAQMNLFRLPLQSTAFDVVICTGVLHHTSDPYLGFKGLIEFAKPGGYLIIGLYNLFGRSQTRFRRLLSRFVGRGIDRLDPYLSNTRMVPEKRLSWYLDQYRNPHESLHTMDEVLSWFDRNGLEFVRAVPNTLFGTEINVDYRRSLFDPEPRGSRLDRLFSQVGQMFSDDKGGLFVMIGRRS
jgi:SAM-dependent methyltransferase